MAILGNIRKRTTILILIIGMALFAFVVSGIFTQNGGGVESSIGVINGEDISAEKFRREVAVMTQNSGGRSSNMQMVNAVWNNTLRKTILNEEFESLGLNIESDQIINVIKSDPNNLRNPTFLNDDGTFNESKFISAIAELKATNPAGYASWLEQEKSIIHQAKEKIYFSLIKLGIRATLKEGEFDYKLANDKVDIKYVKIPYSSIQDSTITINKKEISTYIDDHKKEFKQEEGRSLQYVIFEEKASLEDENTIKETIVKLGSDNSENGFRNTEDMEGYLYSNSDIKFDSTYISKEALPKAFADTLMTLQVGETFGPYKDDGYYKVTRMMGRKSNGSVKASHILIAWKGLESASDKITRTKEDAEKKSKEILKEAQKNTENFAQLAKDNSDGPSASRGGDLGYFQEGQMVKPFNDFAFKNKIKTVGIVETKFGYHIVKIEDKKETLQIATLANEIEPSKKTLDAIFTNATKFEMSVSSEGSDFSGLAKKANYTLKSANDVKIMEENLPELTKQRSVVQWAFNSDRKIGDVKRFNITNGYVIVQLTGIKKEGTISVEDASEKVLPILRKRKKAKQIIEKNKGKSFEDFASANKVSVTNASALDMKTTTISGAGREPMVVGVAFGLDKGETSTFIEGESGVYKIQVTNFTPANKINNYSTYANSITTSNVGRVNYSVYNALKEKSDIEDKRAIFY